MGKHFSHLTPTQRTQIDAFRRAGMKVVDIAKEVGVHYTTSTGSSSGAPMNT